MPLLPRLLLLLLAASAIAAATYEVGPGQALTTIGAVPWESLNAGDTVRIHYKATPYYEKFAINRLGTLAAPITVTGVPDGSGALPMISGLNATTRTQLSYYGRQRSVIKIGQVDAPAAWIVLENLDIARAQGGGTYTAPSGATETYTNSASSIYVETADHVTIRNCVIHDSSNGLFSAYGPSRDILITGCHIYGNGRAGSVYEHNVYTESRGIIFEYNRFGALGAGCPGNNLKDRSAGTVVRYNWIEGGNRQLDLVESQNEDLVAENLGNAAYHTTHVYGNVLVEPVGDGNRQMIHYGGDGNEPDYRKGTLHLYDNTLVSARTDRTVLVRLSTDAESCDARNNVIHVTAAAGSTLALLEDGGVLTLTNNWLKTGYITSITGGGSLTASGNLTGTAPGFVNEAGQDYHLAAGSPCIAGATALAAAVLPAHNVTRQYLSHRQSVARADVQDIGAFARSGGNTAPVVSAATASPATVAGMTTALTATASDDAGEPALTYTWSASPATVAFSSNTTNAAKVSTATFTAAGTYTLTVTARDAGSLTGTRNLTVTVQQTPTALTISPATVSVATGASANLAAAVQDQFAAAIAAPTVTWAVVAGGGTVTAGGVYTAPASAGTATVRATCGSATGNRTVTITADTTAPVISAISASPVTASGATISWTTNEAASTQVEYGLTAAYGSSTTLVATLVTAHSQALGGLTAGTTYHYLVTSRDAAGNPATSADQTFTTSSDTTAPVITAPASGPATVSGTTAGLAVTATDTSGPGGLTYTWTVTSGPAGAVIAPNASNLATSPTITFAHAGTYTVTVTVGDAAGNSTTSGPVTMTVTQTITGVAITETTATVASGGTVGLHGTVEDQFGDPISAAILTWSVDAGGAGGSVSAAGIYSAPTLTVAGDAVVRAASGGAADTVAIHITAGGGSGSGGGSSGSGGSGGCGGGAIGLVLLALGCTGLRRPRRRS